MKKAILTLAVLCGIGFGAAAQSVTDSVRISGKIILNFDELDSPEPFSGAELAIIGNIMGKDYILAATTTNRYGEFTFKMPKGEYEVFLWRNQVYKDYALLLKQTHRKVDAQTDVYIGELTPVIDKFFQYYGDATQKMKIDGVKITVK